MLPENKRAFDFCNITEWHKHGYTGKGIKIAIGDSRFHLSDRVNQNFNGKLQSGTVRLDASQPESSHGSRTAHVIHQIAPDAELYMTNGFGPCVRWATRNEMDLFNISRRILLPGIYNILLNEYAEKGGVMFSSAGNNREEHGLGIPAEIRDCIAVAAANLRHNNTISRTWYSSFTTEYLEYLEQMVEVTGITNLMVKEHNGTPRRFGGTSCACPFITGMAALVAQRYKEQGHKLTIDQFRKYKIDHALDLEVEGWDRQTGYGLMKLGNPQDIKLPQFREINMWLDNKTMTVDGKNMIMDVAPFAVSGRTLVPVRFVAEALGKDVDWDNVTKTVIIKDKDGKELNLWMNRYEMSINGIMKEIDVAPIAVDGRTFVPIRFVAEELGAEVDWIQSTGTVVIRMPTED